MNERVYDIYGNGLRMSGESSRLILAAEAEPGEVGIPAASPSIPKAAPKGQRCPLRPTSPEEAIGFAALLGIVVLLVLTASGVIAG